MVASNNSYFWQHRAPNWTYLPVFVCCNISDGNLWSLLAPLWREIDKCAHWLFCKKFNAEQLLFEAFSHIMRVWQHCVPNWIYFPGFVHYIFQICQSFDPPSSTMEGDRQVHPLTFLYKIQCWTTFIWSASSYNAITLSYIIFT